MNKIKSRFTGKVVEEKWEYGMRGYWSSKDGEWFLHDRYVEVCYPVGHLRRNPMEWNKIKERRTFFEDDLSFKFEAGYKVNINGEVITIIDAIHELDGSITYHTDKELERIVLISEEEARKQESLKG